MARMEPTADVSLACILARSKLGTAIAAMIKMIATTIRSSMSENPFCFRIGMSFASKIHARRGAREENLSLHHVNLGSVLVELHFIHELIDEENSAPVIGIEILAESASGYRLRVEPGAGIANNDEDAAFRVARYHALDDLARIFFGAVNDGIRQGLLQGQFNGVFFAVDAFHFAHRLHHLGHDRVHGLAVGGKRHPHSQGQLFWIEFLFGKMLLGGSPSVHGWLVRSLSARGATASFDFSGAGEIPQRQPD